MKLALLILAMSLSFCLTSALQGVSADCTDMSASVLHDPPVSYGPTYTCASGQTTWTCPHLYTDDILAHDDCGTPGSHPGKNCEENGGAPAEWRGFGCGQSSGDCPLERMYPYASQHKKWRSVNC